jgi:membrane-associated PAP2 superfamily phosphatase
VRVPDPERPGSQDRTRYWVTHALLPFLAAGALLVLFENTRLDRALLDPFYDEATRTFPLRHAWLFTLVFKDGLKTLVIALGAALMIGLLASLWRPKLVPWRRTMLYVLLALALAPLTVAALKYTSCKHCPWDLDFYGGKAPYSGLLGCPPPGFGPGECFPSGHASGGFALFALYFAYRIRAPRRARLWFWVAIAYGNVMGVSRMMQGAHFLSHNVATAFVCWFTCLVLYELVLRRYDERRFAATVVGAARDPGASNAQGLAAT